MTDLQRPDAADAAVDSTEPSADDKAPTVRTINGPAAEPIDARLLAI